MWELFKKYHYLSTNLNKSAHNYIGYIDNNPVCFSSVLHFPHSRVKNFKKGHRLVVLPDYQGLGIGHIMSSCIAQTYLDKGFRFIITNSSRALFKQRERDPRWIITAKKRCNFPKDARFKKTGTDNKITYSYEYIGLKKDNNNEK